MKVDFEKFEHSLPYASEVYGVYQPLIGWKSALMQRRVRAGLDRTRLDALAQVTARLRPRHKDNGVTHPEEVRFEIEPAVPASALAGPLVASLDSVVGRHVARAVDELGADDPQAWKRVTSADKLREIIDQSTDDIQAAYRSALAESPRLPAETVLKSLLDRESAVAGLLLWLNESSTPQQLKEMLSPPASMLTPRSMIPLFESLDPATSSLTGAVISPIGVVHLFRQYFFEFDSFLGPPVQHLWLSPGGTVELVEVSTRKTAIERTIEQSFETVQKSEKSSTTQDELSDAVRNENASNTKLGVSLDTSTSFGNEAIFTSQINAGSSFDIDRAQKDAREQIHRGLRQQTEKLSSQIRQSFKSTFRVVTETTDVNSRRYVIENTSDSLVNYELRRKMRQVGVQVQDYGTHLCWQTYVNEPGRELGVARLVHIAEPSDIQVPKDPELVPEPEPLIRAAPVTLQGEWMFEDRKWDFVPFLGQLELTPPKPGYIFDRAEVIVTSGPLWYMRALPARSIQIPTGDGGQEESVTTLAVGVQTDTGGLETDEHPTFTVQVTVLWRPSRALIKQVHDENTARIDKSTAEKAAVFQAALFKEARERIKAASNIEPRPFADLREEERIVVYRNLVRKLLAAAGLTNPDARLRHVFAEIVQSMFDVDRMLYFVAPEWWTPRALPFDHTTPQDVGLGDATNEFVQKNVVSWGGADESRPDNYFITEDSIPARLGSSLGWLIQLDGDNLRNAFLNAPWVKAVVPIRPGREWEALAWLSSPAVEGDEGLSARYRASDDERERIVATLRAYAWDDPALATYYASLEPQEVTILDAIRYLIVRIQAKQLAGQTKEADPDDLGLSYLPTDKVYEHGFDPLAGGFTAQATKPFEIFDQWVEVLPTDQIVPVEVAYDPITGMQKVNT